MLVIIIGEKACWYWNVVLKITTVLFFSGKGFYRETMLDLRSINGGNRIELFLYVGS